MIVTRIKSLILALMTMGIMTMPAFGVGSTNQSLAQIPSSTNYVFTENWTADAANGSVPATVMAGTSPIQGFRIVSVEIAPGSPAPTNLYTVTVTDFSGADLLGGSGASQSNTTATILPSLSTAPPLYGSLTVNVTGNSVNSAQGRILIYFAPVSQVIGNTPTGASLTGNNLFTGANTFQGTTTLSGTNTLSGSSTATGTLTSTNTATYANLDAIQMVDGVTNTTVQQAINKLPVGGGIVYVPPGTYVGPTTIPSNTHLLCLSDAKDPNSFGVSGEGTVGTGCQLTYSSTLVLKQVNNIWMQNFFMNCSASQISCLQLQSVSFSHFDLRIDCQGNGTANSTVCLLMNTAGVGTVVINNSIDNVFDRLLINAGNGSEAIKLIGSTNEFVTNNFFGNVTINGASVTGTFQIEFNSNCDTNYFGRIYGNITGAGANGVIFNNSATPNSFVDADDEALNWIIFNVPGGYTGKLLTFNASTGNRVRVSSGATWNLVSVNTTTRPTFEVNWQGGIDVVGPPNGLEDDITGIVCVNAQAGNGGSSSGCGSVPQNGDIAVARTSTSGQIAFGYDNNLFAISRSGTDLQLNTTAVGNADVLLNSPLRGPLLQMTTGAAVTAAVGAGWGTSATIGAAANPPTLQETNSSRWLITSGSAAFAASPTVTFTLNTPFLFSQVPSCQLNTQHITGTGGALNFNPTSVSNSSVTFTAETNTGAAFTPAVTETYTVALSCF